VDVAARDAHARRSGGDPQLTRNPSAADNDRMTLRIAKTLTALGFFAALAALFGRRPA
jgi:hypothetical protein